MYNEVIFSSLSPFNQKNMLNRIHHIAIICSDYEKSKHFYTHVLGLEVVKETYREERQSYKLDLSLHGEYIIELFSFPNPPERISRPEARGLRHLAFEVDDLQKSVNDLKNKKIEAEPIRLDKATQKYFTFIFDPDHLPIELYEK
ncbi:VOC family protein [Legionella israelensis]|uniref:Putative lyase n=1 Tax=Legionella israelensis TaxID=454 RepID=A0A0W0WS43_9GAMM|nr:VOC family protein [Legionella israelensis]KTD35153.1 putative lyase [Legionella israelensis]SCY00902.1 glyoxylase I family protein [Legionella israelensis DSM 19235]STX58362.1 putative lyase [Legionella israelensis]